MDPEHRRIDAACLAVGYAMSRLDAAYLAARGLGSWRAAYSEAAHAFARPAGSFKNLRDEFDPWHANSRKGWRSRPPRPDRLRVMGELSGMGDEALLALVDRLLALDMDSTKEAVDALSDSVPVSQRVAERLLTGRRAEAHFLTHSQEIANVDPNDLLDCRDAAGGYDFGVRGNPNLAIEVKGLRDLRGELLFTDREWREAKLRRLDYWVVVVGNIATTPIARLLRDPVANLAARCAYQRTLVANWRAPFGVDANP